MLSFTRFAVLLVAVAAITTLSLAFSAGPAAAAHPCEDADPPPSCFDVTVEEDDHTLTVTRTVGAVQSTPSGISCGSTCSAIFTSTRTCDYYECSDWEHESVTLTASGLPSGYAANWTNCTPSTGTSCSREITANTTIAMTAVDVTPPNVTFNPPAKVGGVSPVVVASCSDNSGTCASYIWTVDAVAQAATGNSLSLAGIAAGTHTVTVGAKDPNNNVSSSVGRSVVVDKSAGISLAAIDDLTNTIPSLSFTKDADVVTTKCAVWSGGVEPAGTDCASGTAALAAGAADAMYSVKVSATDDVGNSATVTESFTLDRTLPALAITSGPAEGEQISGSATTFTFTASDLHLAAVTCQLDGAPAGNCAGADSEVLSGLAAGAHQLTLRASDTAGNVATLTRNFSVAVSGGPNGPSGDTANPAAATASWKVAKGKTSIRKLAISKLPAGATVTVSCKGKGCPFKSKAATVAGGKADIAKLFKRKVLKAKARITIVVAAAGYKTATFTYTTQAKKKPKSAVS